MPFYQFGSVVFTPRQSDLVPAVNAPSPTTSERHVPYSNITIIDSGGFGPRRWAAQIRLTSNDVNAMQNKLMSTDVLYVQGVAWPQATLMKLDNHQITPLPLVASLPDFVPQYHFFDAEWIIGGLPV